MRFTDWFLKQLCTHTHEITGWSAFSLYETRTFRTRNQFCKVSPARRTRLVSGVAYCVSRGSAHNPAA